MARVTTSSGDRRGAARARVDLDAAPNPDAGDDPAAEDARLADLETALQTLHRKEGELAQAQARLAQLEQELENLPAAPPHPEPRTTRASWDGTPVRSARAAAACRASWSGSLITPATVTVASDSGVGTS